MTKTVELYEVWWVSAGCLPDSEFPTFIGTIAECLGYIKDDPDGYFDAVGENNLYTFSINPHTPEEE